MKATPSADSLARQYTERAVEVVAEAMESADLKTALAAAKEMLARGHGMPAQAIIQVPATQRLQRQLNEMTDAQLLEAIEGEYHELPVLPPPDTQPAAIDPLLL